MGRDSISCGQCHKYQGQAFASDKRAEKCATRGLEIAAMLKEVNEKLKQAEASAVVMREALKEISATCYQPNHKDGAHGTHWDMTQKAREALR